MNKRIWEIQHRLNDLKTEIDEITFYYYRLLNIHLDYRYNPENYPNHTLEENLLQIRDTIDTIENFHIDTIHELLMNEKTTD